MYYKPITSIYLIATLIPSIVGSVVPKSHSPSSYISLLGTKGPYPFLNESWSIITTNDLVLSQIQLVMRHGTRAPTSSGLRAINDLVQFVQLHQSHITFEPLKNLSNPWTAHDEGQLTLAGKQDLQRIAKNSFTRYSSFLDSITDWNEIFIQSSGKSRVTDSADAFTKFFLPPHLRDNATRNMIIYDKSLDADLRPSDTCTSFKNRDEQSLKKQADLWFQKTFPAIAKQLSGKIFSMDVNSNDNMSLTAQQALDLIEFCAFQVSAFRLRPDQGICSLFSRHDFETYETHQDLQSYYSYGYGDSFSSKVTCSLITSILDTIQAGHLDGEYQTHKGPAPKLYLRFTHAETLMPLMVSLGLFKDSVPITSSTPTKDLENRAWKISSFTPFTGHVWIETYIYKNSQNDVGNAAVTTGTIYLRLIVDDIPVELPGCTLRHPQNPYLCEWNSFKSMFPEGSMYGCSFDEMCGNSFQTNGSWRTHERTRERFPIIQFQNPESF